MECHSERPPYGTSNPSFSASLLDAIYRTLDGPDLPEAKMATTIGTNDNRDKPKPNQSEQKKKCQSDLWRSTNKKQLPPSNMSSNSSSHGISSDAQLYQSKPARMHTTRDKDNPPALPPKALPHEKKKKSKSNPIRSHFRDLTKVHTNTGTSTTSAFGNLIKAIFSSTRSLKKNKKKKQHVTAMEVEPTEKLMVPVPVPEPALEHRVVRFGESRDLDVDHDMDMDAEAVKTRVEDVLRGSKNEKGEDVEEQSEESSDLFELENLTSETGSDELPLYNTTSLVTNHPPVCCT